MCLEAPLAGFPIGHVGVHEAFEDPAVVGYEQVDEFVDDDELSFARLLVLRGHKSVQKATGRFMVKNRSMSPSIPRGKT